MAVLRGIQKKVMNQGSLEKWPVLGPGQGKHKMCLEHLAVPESKGVLKKQREENRSKGHSNQPERAPDGKAGTI